MVKTKVTSFRTGLMSGEIEVVEMQNDLLKLSILAGRGADLVEIIYKPKDFNLAWQSNTGWPVAKTPVDHPADMESFLDGYPGGWQSVFPNGGAPCEFNGIAFGQHDEVATLAWSYEVLVDDDNEISIKFITNTRKLKFIYEKTFTLRKGIAIVFLREKITNLIKDTVMTMWGNHISFGEPFIDEFSTIDIGHEARVIPHDVAISSVGRRLKANEEFTWPLARGEGGDEVDFSKIPPKKTKSEILYLHELKYPKYSINSPTIGLCVQVSWDKTNFPYLWFWQEFGGANEYPWFGKHFNIGLEPFSSYPTNGLAEAVENGSALVFGPLEEKTSSIEYKVLEMS